jgi:hypothetical protein
MTEIPCATEKECTYENNELRNQVVHKNAYRPSREEVEAATEETRGILFPLARYLSIDYDDIHWYIRGD